MFPVQLAWACTAYLMVATTVSAYSDDERKREQLAYHCFDYENYEQLNVWSKASSCEYSGNSIPAGRVYHASALFRRGPYWAQEKHRDNTDRLLVFSGYIIPAGYDIRKTWLYTPVINSWYQPQIELEPPYRSAHSLTTLCDSDVILFGGWNGWKEMADTWLFDGVTETWMEISPFPPSDHVPARKFHSAVAMSQPKSSCPCKESLVVYGGIGLRESCLGDMWELRCNQTDDGVKMFTWLPLMSPGKEHVPPSRKYHGAVAVNKSVMFMWGGYLCQSNGWTQSKDLWKYDLQSNSWTVGHKQLTLDNSFSENYDVSVPLLFTPVFYPKTQSIVALSLHYSILIDPVTSNLTRKTTFNQAEQEFPSFSTASVLEDTILICGGIGDRYEERRLVWSLTFIDEDMGWAFASNPMPKTKPRSSWIARNNIFLAGDSFHILMNRYEKLMPLIGYGLEYFRDPTTVWHFDLNQRNWWRTYSGFYPQPSIGYALSVLNDSMIVLFGDQLSWTNQTYLDTGVNDKTTTSALWVYNVAMTRWSLFGTSSQHVPIPRYLASLVSLTNGSLLLFGGSPGSERNDLWLLDVCSHDVFHPLDKHCVTWTQIRDSDSSVRSSPSPRYRHFATTTRKYMVVYGGSYIGVDGTEVVKSDMWLYNLENGRWIRTFEKCALNIPYLYEVSMLAIGSRVVSLPGYASLSSQPKRMPEYNCNVGSSMVTSTLFITDKETLLSTLSNQHTFERAWGIFSWRQRLILVGTQPFPDPLQSYDTMITFMNPSCPAGWYSRDWASEMCQQCDFGSFAAINSTHCTPCPEGLTTLQSASSNKSACVCKKDYCSHGKCFESVTSLETAAVCSCDLGYTGNQCQYPTYFIIAASAVLLILCALTVFFKRMRKFRKEKIRAQAQLIEMKRLWSITGQEVELGRPIDGESPGSYGSVYRATYREIPVAVKILKPEWLTDETISKEFGREIKIMRSIRHPNIVMFIGAGEFERDGSPFLVLELLTNGSLTRLLRNMDVYLSSQQRISFASDAARGMQFLHGLRPPRIHRDLKSGNLLVSSRMVVKVADFGSARMVSREGVRQPMANSRNSNNNVTGDRIPLAPGDEDMTHGEPGTVYWRAPEVFSRRSYGTSADVYSFGIVMWELVAREMPYEDIREEFTWISDVREAICSGMRPTIPLGISDEYKSVWKPAGEVTRINVPLLLR